MMFWKPFNRLVMCVLFCAGTVLLSVSGRAATVDRIIAKVNEDIITQSEVEERAYLKLMGLRKAKAPSIPSKDEMIYRELELMVEEKLLISAGRNRGYKVNEKRVAKAIGDIEAHNGLKAGELEKMLEAESQSLEDYKNNIREQILMSDVRSYEVRKRVHVSREEIEGYYSQHLKEFWVAEKLKLRHILFLMGNDLSEEDRNLKRQMARQALQKIRAGGDFSAVAKEFSEDISAGTGGDLGEMERGKMVPEFEKAAFLLKEGQVSGLVETPYGLHIIRVDKIYPGRTLPLNEVEGRIKNWFLDRKAKAEYQAFLQELKQKAFIEIKISRPAQSVTKQVTEVNPSETLKEVSDSGVEPEVLSSQRPVQSKTKMSPKQEFSRFQVYEDKLRYYKELRDNDKISEGDYHLKKKQLLNRL